MFSYTRLLELAGRPRLILERLSPDDAGRIFALHGVDVSGMDDAALKAAHRTLVKNLHPDRRGGDHTAMAEINAAYDLLKTGVRPGRPSQTSSGPSGPSGPSGASARTRPAGGGMNCSQEGARARADADQPDFRCIDDIKEYFSRETQDEPFAARGRFTVTGFDGTFARQSVTVPGTSAMFSEMAHVMRIWQEKGSNSYPCRAVMVQDAKNPAEVLVIWAAGHDLDPPLVLEHDSFNANFSNDQSFMRRLPDLIAAEVCMRFG